MKLTLSVAIATVPIIDSFANLLKIHEISVMTYGARPLLYHIFLVRQKKLKPPPLADSSQPGRLVLLIMLEKAM